MQHLFLVYSLSMCNKNCPHPPCSFSSSLKHLTSHNLGDSDIPASTLRSLFTLASDESKLWCRILDLVDGQMRRTLTTATRVFEQDVCLVLVKLAQENDEIGVCLF